MIFIVSEQYGESLTCAVESLYERKNFKLVHFHILMTDLIAIYLGHPLVFCGSLFTLQKLLFLINEGSFYV